MRLFVALDIPQDVRASISTLIAKLRPTCSVARWMRMENVHLTLKFIGEVPSETFEAIKAALDAVLFPEPFEISIQSLGFFPSERRPRVLWAGIAENTALNALAAGVETALEPLGIARELRVFSPHLTLARFESGRGLDGLKSVIAEAGRIEFGDMAATEFHLYQSVLKRGGAEYTRLATYGISGEKLR